MERANQKLEVIRKGPKSQPLSTPACCLLIRHTHKKNKNKKKKKELSLFHCPIVNLLFFSPASFHSLLYLASLEPKINILPLLMAVALGWHQPVSEDKWVE